MIRDIGAELGMPAFTQMEKSKMTRKEAIEACGDTHEATLFVARLHALGLLKFEERPTPECIFSMMFDSISADRPHTKAKELSNWLDRMGYKIVDK